MLIVCQFFVGFGCTGLFNAAYTLLSESVAAKDRTHVMILAKCWFTVGSLLAALGGWATLGTGASWRVFLAVCGLPSLIMAPLIYFLDESPRYLLSSGQTEKAHQILLKMCEMNKCNINVDINDLMASGTPAQENRPSSSLSITISDNGAGSSMGRGEMKMYTADGDGDVMNNSGSSSSGASDASTSTTDRESDSDSDSSRENKSSDINISKHDKNSEKYAYTVDVKESLNVDKSKNIDRETTHIDDVTLRQSAPTQKQGVSESERGSISSLFLPQYRTTSICIIFIAFSVAFNFYGVNFIQPRFFHKEGESDEVDTRSSHVYISVISSVFVEIPGRLAPLLFLDHIGRVKSMVWVNILMFVVFMMLAGNSATNDSYNQATNEVLNTGLLALSRMLGGCLWSISALYVIESFPTSNRAVAMGMYAVAGRVGGIITTFVSENSNISLAVTCFAGFSLLGAFAAYSLPNDTTGKELSDFMAHDEERRHSPVARKTYYSRREADSFSPFSSSPGSSSPASEDQRQTLLSDDCNNSDTPGYMYGGVMKPITQVGSV